ncbi:MAG: S-layer homology domain-containing protein [Oscillospiraceae bacterium]|nr:S-layer homology domain-containing protein [Oscillospiraceae bacterium]
MKRKIISAALAALMLLAVIPVTALAYSDAANGDWSEKSAVVKNTAEAELVVRVGDIDALNDYTDVADSGYDPFSAANQYSHSYPWEKDEADPMGTDRIYVGSAWSEQATDGYSSNYCRYKNGDDDENAYGEGALEITMSYDASGVTVKNALLQLCIDDFQAISWESVFTVKLNGRDAPFIAELLNHVDQTGPTAYVVSAIVPASFYEDVASGRLVITVDETTGCGDGFAIDFARLLVNYKNDVFKGRFTGKTEPGATVRLLGTSTTVTASSTGGFEFEAVPGLNAVRASKDGYVEGYDFGIVFSKNAAVDEYNVWEASVDLDEGEGSADIDFSQFGVTAAWETASSWATAELEEADALGLIPDCLRGGDLTQPITRAEFAAVSVKVYEALSGTKAEPAAVNPFTDTSDEEVLKAFNVGVTNGMSDTTFEPDTLLNRQTAATMLTRVYKKTALDGWTLETDGSYNEQFKGMFTQPESFADDADISGWAKDSVYFMAANGIINGVGGNKFAPRAVTSAEEAAGYARATREQALLIAARMVKNLG